MSGEKNDVIGGWESAMAEIEDDGSLEPPAPARPRRRSREGSSGGSNSSSPWETVEAPPAVHSNNERPPVPPSSSLTISVPEGDGTTSRSAAPPRPPLPVVANLPPRQRPSRSKSPYTMSRSSGDDSSSVGSDVYIRADGKKVRRVRKNRTVLTDSSDDDEVTVSSIASDVYVRADGKRVRRVKRKKKKGAVKHADAGGERTNVVELTAAGQVKPPVAARKVASRAPEKAAKELKANEDGTPTVTSIESELAPVALLRTEHESQSLDKIPEATFEPELTEQKQSALLETKASPSLVKEEVVSNLNAPQTKQNYPVTDDREKTLVELLAEQTALVAATHRAYSNAHEPAEQKQSKVEPVNPFLVPLTMDDSASKTTIPAGQPVDHVTTSPQHPQPPQESPKHELNTQPSDKNPVVSPFSSGSSVHMVQPTGRKPSKHLTVDTGAPREDRRSDQDDGPLLIVDSDKDFDDASTLTGDDDGGRLWQRSLRQEEQRGRPRIQLPEQLMARTRSRADVDTPMVMSPLGNSKATPTMIRIDEDEEAQMFNTDLAHKRVRVVQLLVVGSIGLLAGLFGSFFVSSTCHFATSSVSVGQNERTFKLHYGLWKYTPMDSVFQGYSYCYQYDDNYTVDSPFFARIAGLMALVAGMYSVFVLWFYLIMGRARRFYWRLGVKTAIAAGICQSLTFLFFVGSVCRRNTCQFGPGAVVSVLSTIAWFILAYEMSYNRPTSKFQPEIKPASTFESNLVGHLEMSDFKTGAKFFFRRMTHTRQDLMPSLNRVQRSNDQRMAEMMSEGSYRPSESSYRPPFVAA